jgi:DNA-directed DNA polymerase III PolC
MRDFKQFPTVHCHPASLDSASTPAAFAKRELEIGSGAITCTDHGTLQAAQQIYELGKAKKLIPIVGLEAYFRDDDCPILKAHDVPKTDTVPKGSDRDEWAKKNPQGTFIDYWKYAHVTMHFMDEPAYLCAVRLLSKADLRAEQHGSERKPLFAWSDLEELASHNVTATSSCLIGIVQRHLMSQNNPTIGKAYFDRMKHLFGDRFYVEVFPHTCTHDYVEAVFIDVGTPEEKETLRFKWEKKLKTDAGEFYAQDIAENFNPEKHGKLLAHSHYRKWYDFDNPRQILAVRKEKGFIKNECRPWAPDSDVQRGCNKFVLSLAKSNNVPVVIGDDSHFVTEDEKIIQDIRLAQQGPWRFHGSYHRQTSREAFLHFEQTLGLSEDTFEGWVDNAIGWSQRFTNFKFNTEPSLPTKFYPEATLAHTKTLIEKHGRMRKTDPRAMKRLKAEIDLVHRNGIDLLPYFMIDEEVCSFFESKGLLTGPGRGSAAGLSLAYYEGITHIDPLKYDLSMDRFMTPDRIRSKKMPDIDQDLPKKHRDLLLDPENGWLKQRFGDHYAQISVDTTLKLKNAVKDVSRAVRDHVPYDIENWTKRFEMPPQGVTDYNFVMGYVNDEGWVTGSIETDKNLQAYIDAYPKDWELVKKCLGLARQKGRHACAYVIANKPIHEFIPLTSVSGIRCTSFTAGPVEAVGGLKMDFLGLGSLDDIGDAIQLIQQRHGETVDMSQYEMMKHDEAPVGYGGAPPCDRRFSLFLDGRRVPSQRLVPRDGKFVDIWDLPDDQKVFAEVAQGRTETVFQFNTPGAIKWLAHFNYTRADGTKAIDSVGAMAAFTALDRPGPLNIDVMNPDWQGDPNAPEAKHNMLVEFARRARGATPSPEVLPILDELVPETYGVLTYQEQLQRVYQNLTGCTGSEAEEFRTNVAKKKKEKVDAAYPGWMERAGAKIGPENAQKLWEFIKTWAKYGFNKSHAVCYAAIAYACAYLKHHYPLEWWTAVLRNATKDEVNKKFWQHCGHHVLLPDIQFSKENWTIEGSKIRAPLSLIHGIGDSAHEQLMKFAPYTSILDFAEKIRIHREATKTMVNRKKKGTEEYEKKEQLGRSAIHRGIVHILVVSGAMTSLFPEDASIDDCMAAYDKAMTEVFGKAYSKSKKRDYPRLDPLGRYQLRKKAIPAYGEDLRPLVMYAGLPPFLEVIDGKRMRFKYIGYSKKQRREIPMNDAVVGVTRFQALDNADTVPDGGWKCAVLACVEEAESFQYQQGAKTARKLLLDVGGAKYRLVHWPVYEGEVPEEAAKCEPGSVVAVLLIKREVGREFAIKELRVVRGPLKEKAEKDEEDADKHDEPAAADQGD